MLQECITLKPPKKNHQQKGLSNKTIIKLQLRVTTEKDRPQIIISPKSRNIATGCNLRPTS